LKLKLLAYSVDIKFINDLELMSELQNAYRIVEQCIENLGLDPTTVRGEKEGQWSLNKGSAKVWIDVWHIEKEDRAYFQAMSPVMQDPANNTDLYRELLEINDKLFGVAFTLYNGWVWLKMIREVEGMDENEAFAMITRIGNYADQYDDLLIGKYATVAHDNGGASGGPGGPTV
jgi:hypothetical protein